ncbi:extracellular solute-binding protein [Terrarubrum flagellatum]|uniref:extracellular solute-binding protein n=1 Tax=Terrirubrum flagellatum TaxID=2895980 RepID=UPI0031451DAA
MAKDSTSIKLSRRAFAAGATAAGFTVAAPSVLRAQAVEIEYWQYFFKERVEAMDELIKQFQAANPGVTVKHTHFPYAQYRTKTAAAVPAGEGPTVLQLFFGWMREYAKAKLIQPLPSDMFKTADVDREYFDVVKMMKNSEGYWALPTAVRSLGMFYNKRLMKEANLGEKPAGTLDDYVKYALATAKRDGGGNLTQAGATIGVPGQDYHWWREVLIRQHGAKPYTDDFRKVTYDNDAGASAIAWYTDLQRKHKVAQAGFLSEGQAAFRAGRAAQHIDGSFRLGTFRAARGFEWGVAELPTHKGVAGNYSSYWVNGLAANATGAKKEAALKFLAFVTSDAAMQLWFDKTGELPAKKASALTPKNLSDPLSGPMLSGLNVAFTTDFVSEEAQGQLFQDMLDRILLQNQDPLAAVKQMAEAEQKMIDDHYKA